jgi:hypothetical protein
VGRLQARRERRRGLQVPSGVIEVSANIVGKTGSVRAFATRGPVCDVFFPRGEGAHLPFIGQGEVIYRHATLFSYVWRYGVQCRGVGGCPGGPCPGLGVVVCPVLEQGRLRGRRRSSWPGRLQAGSRKPLTVIRTVYSGRRGGVPSPRAQQRRSCCSSARCGAAGAGMAAQD